MSEAEPRTSAALKGSAVPESHNLKRFLSEFGTTPSPELRRYLGERRSDEAAVARLSEEMSGGLWHPGGTSRGRFVLVSSSRGSDAAPIQFVHLYVSLDDYIPLEETPDGTPESAIREIVDTYDRRLLLLALAALNRQCDRSEDLERLTGYYRSVLTEAPRRRLDAAISRREGSAGKPRIVARQCVLAAMEEVLRHPLEDGVRREEPDVSHAIMLSHAFGTAFGLEEEHSDEEICGVPADMLMYLVRNAALYREDDAYAAMDRTVRLWREFGPKVQRVKLRAKPADLLREATGLEIEDLLALGFAAWANEHMWAPEKPLLLARDFGGAMSADRIELFLSVVTASLEEYRITLRDSDSQFDFVAFERKPVVELDNGLLVLDGRLLWQRFTFGLYWLVHDHEKLTRGSERDRHLWTQGYGEMVEEMVKDQIRAIAPTLLGSKRDKGFYDDEDFKRAYGEGVSRPDAAVDRGHHLLLFEVQSGQLSTGTRVKGDPKSFERDTERLVLKKCRQLDSAARAVLADPGALTEAAPYPDVRLLPFVVVGGGYPGEAVSGGCVENLLAEEGLLDLDGVGKLGILSPAELEILEGLFESGEDITALLIEWKSSGLRNVSLWNFLAGKFSDHSRFRPTRMETRVEGTFDDLEARLRPRSGPDR